MAAMTELIGGPLDGEEIDLDEIVNATGECVALSHIEEIVLAYTDRNDLPLFAMYLVREWRRRGRVALVFWAGNLDDA